MAAPKLPDIDPGVGGYLARGVPNFKARLIPGIDYPKPEADIIVRGRKLPTTIEPWKFGLAIAFLAVIWFILPKGSHWWLMLLLVGGALAASNIYAEQQNIPSPLQSIGGFFG